MVAVEWTHLDEEPRLPSRDASLDLSRQSPCSANPLRMTGSHLPRCQCDLDRFSPAMNDLMPASKIGEWQAYA